MNLDLTGIIEALRIISRQTYDLTNRLDILSAFCFITIIALFIIVFTLENRIKKLESKIDGK